MDKLKLNFMLKPCKKTPKNGYTEVATKESKSDVLFIHERKIELYQLDPFFSFMYVL